VVKLAQMGPKPIQDVAPPSQAASSPAEPLSGPELVNDIPVRAVTMQPSSSQEPAPSKDDDTSFIDPAASLPVAAKNDKQRPKTKDAKSKPTLATAVAVLAAVCLAAGAYLKFFSNS